jgi:GNAT superfamily N-acetyltransferase
MAAALLTDWGDRAALDVIVMPDATPDWVAHVVERGLAHASESGFAAVEFEVDRADDVLREELVGRGFTIKGDAMVETWLAADARPEISALHADYRLCSRLDTTPRPHHMIQRCGPDVEQRLLQTSLYRPDLDLIVVDRTDNYAAHGLFWYDAATATGLVEPMRTEDDHQRRGLARHVLTAGIDLLARAGAARIKIIFEHDNPAARNLYLGVGFEPVKQTVIASGRTDAGRHPSRSMSRLA